MEAGKPPPAGAHTVDIVERAGHHTGNPQELHTRLFMQLLVFDCSAQLSPTKAIDELEVALRAQRCSAVIYEDVNAPRGLAVLTWSEDPAHFVRTVRPALLAVAGLEPRRDFAMFGRTYSTGYEPDLKFWLLERPVKTVLDESCAWSIWYPLKRKGEFNRLEGKDQGAILREHGSIGRAYGEQDLAHDIRLACFGLDQADNDFVIGLVGKELHPLSHVVQAMRKTRQTSELMEHMGPFLVGHAVRRVAF
jgi:chlorite dismutase